MTTAAKLSNTPKAILPTSMSLRNADTGAILVARLEIARTLWQRGVGLIGRKGMAKDEGLWLRPCNSIHTFGLRFAIDLLFLDRDGKALRIACNVPPCRVCGPVRGAKTVVELPAGALEHADVRVGTRFEVVAAGSRAV